MSAAKQCRENSFSLNSGHSTLLVIGLGNPLRGDDSVGRIVASEVKKRNHPFLNVLESSGEGTALMELWMHAGAVIVVDAVASGAKMGTVHRFDVSQRPLPARFDSNSTHGFGLAEAVELARVLRKLPERLIVFGIEGQRFEIGSKLSSEVKKIVPSAVDRVIEEARKLLAAQGLPCAV